MYGFGPETNYPRSIHLASSTADCFIGGGVSVKISGHRFSFQQPAALHPEPWPPQHQQLLPAKLCKGLPGGATLPGAGKQTPRTSEQAGVLESARWPDLQRPQPPPACAAGSTPRKRASLERLTVEPEEHPTFFSKSNIIWPIHWSPLLPCCLFTSREHLLNCLVLGGHLCAILQVNSKGLDTSALGLF